MAGLSPSNSTSSSMTPRADRVADCSAFRSDLSWLRTTRQPADRKCLIPCRQPVASDVFVLRGQHIRYEAALCVRILLTAYGRPVHAEISGRYRGSSVE